MQGRLAGRVPAPSTVGPAAGPPASPSCSTKCLKGGANADLPVFFFLLFKRKKKSPRTSTSPRLMSRRTGQSHGRVVNQRHAGPRPQPRGLPGTPQGTLPTPRTPGPRAGTRPWDVRTKTQRECGRHRVTALGTSVPATWTPSVRLEPGRRFSAACLHCLGLCQSQTQVVSSGKQHEGREMPPQGDTEPRGHARRPLVLGQRSG